MALSAIDQSAFSRTAASVSTQPPGRSPSDFMTWLADGNARVLGSWSDGAGTGVLTEPAPAVRAVLDFVDRTVSRTAP